MGPLARKAECLLEWSLCSGGPRPRTWERSLVAPDAGNCFPQQMFLASISRPLQPATEPLLGGGRFRMDRHSQDQVPLLMSILSLPAWGTGLCGSCLSVNLCKSTAWKGMFARAPEVASNHTGQEPMDKRPVPQTEILGGTDSSVSPQNRAPTADGRNTVPTGIFLPALTRSPHILIPAHWDCLPDKLLHSDS